MNVLNSYFKFAGKSSLDFGLTIESPVIAKKPSRKVNRLTIPGKGREFIEDEGTYENVEVSYQTWCADKRGRDLVISRIGEIYDWLSAAGYQVLSDTYDPDYFRLGWCCEALDPEIILRSHARQDITFSCDPYRYSWAGAERQVWGDSAFYINDGAPSLPCIKIYGQGNIELSVATTSPSGNADTWSAVFDVDQYIELDSFEMDTTKDGVNQNFRKTGTGYPVFGTGEVKVKLTPQGTYDSRLDMEIIPRWRKL